MYFWQTQNAEVREKEWKEKKGEEKQDYSEKGKRGGIKRDIVTMAIKTREENWEEKGEKAEN